jgi:hypothetical protein
VSRVRRACARELPDSRAGEGAPRARGAGRAWRRAAPSIDSSAAVSARASGRAPSSRPGVAPASSSSSGSRSARARPGRPSGSGASSHGSGSGPARSGRGRRAGRVGLRRSRRAGALRPSTGCPASGQARTVRCARLSSGERFGALGPDWLAVFVATRGVPSPTGGPGGRHRPEARTLERAWGCERPCAQNARRRGRPGHERVESRSGERRGPPPLEVTARDDERDSMGTDRAASRGGGLQWARKRDPIF